MIKFTRPRKKCGSNLELRFTFFAAKTFSSQDQRISFCSQSHATHAARSPNFFTKETICMPQPTHAQTPNHSNLRDQREHRAGRHGCRAGRGRAPEASDQRLPSGLGDGRRTHHRPQGHSTAQPEAGGSYCSTTPTRPTRSATTTSPPKGFPSAKSSPPAT